VTLVAGGIIYRPTGYRTVFLGLLVLWHQKKPDAVYQNCPDIIGSGFSEQAARMKTQISFTQAVDGYLLAANARRLSQHPLLDYINTYRRLIDYLQADPPIEEVSADLVEAFLASRQVSKKTVLNYHTGLSALWT
jgi:hypothetical protein